MITTSQKKRSRFSCDSDGISSSSDGDDPEVNIMSSQIDKEEEYERAVAFLRNFHSTRVAALSTPSRSPLGAISENGIGDLINDFSVALRVESSSTTTVANPTRHPSLLSRSPKIKKTSTFTCLLDLDAPSSSSINDEKVVDGSSLFSVHQQARDEFPESCSSSSDDGVLYNGLNGLGNKRHCSRIR
jgi:hypothetical protein